MKQGTVITKVIMFVFLAAVLVYLGYSVFGAVYDPLTTTTAVVSTAGESRSVTLWLAREEEPVHSTNYIVDLTVSDGEKVAAGGEIARSYRSDAYFDRQQELDEMQARLAQLQYTHQEGLQIRLDADTVHELDERIDESITELNRSRGDLLAAADQAVSLQTLVLRRTSSDVDQSLLESNIDTLQQEIDELSAQISANASSITVEHTGWFSSVCDGYETVLTPDALQNASVLKFEALTEKPAQPSAAYIGRLVTSSVWYAAALLPEETARELERLSTIQVNLHDSLDDLISMDVESVSAPANGQCLLVLSSDECLQDVIGLRTAKAGLVTQLYSGLRVPKQAIRVGEDGSAGVYVVEGARAVFKPVTILYDNGDTYVVEEDRSSTDHLWAGDEIIVSARNLYDGKVVKS